MRRTFSSLVPLVEKFIYIGMSKVHFNLC
jgi:hypothetical protein